MAVNLPSYLRVTPEKEQQIESDQAQWRVGVHTVAATTDDEQMMRRGMQMEEIARLNLSSLEKTETERIAIERARLAEGLRLQGRYLEAAKATTDKTQARAFKAIQKAIDKSDEHRCKCKDDVHESHTLNLKYDPQRHHGMTNNNDGTHAIHRHHARERIFSRKHGRAVDLVQCVKCGDLNARTR